MGHLAGMDLWGFGIGSFFLGWGPIGSIWAHSEHKGCPYLASTVDGDISVKAQLLISGSMIEEFESTTNSWKWRKS